MHNPFSLSKLIPTDQLGQDAITAVLLHANRIYLGNDKGNVLVFDLNQNGSGLDRSATFVAKHSVTKKPIDQLAIIKELNALVCLSAGDLTLNSLPTLSLLSSFSTQTKQSASLFTLTTTIHTPPYTPPRRSTPKSTASTSTSAPPPTAPPEIHSTLAIAARRRLLLFSWIDGAWLPPAELSLPHQIRGMAFDQSGGPNARRLVAGFSTGEYGVVTLPPFPNHQGKLPDGSTLPPPTLGELFTPAVPAAPSAALSASTNASATGVGEGEKEKSAPVGSKAKAGALGGLGSVMSLSGLSTGFGGLNIGGKKVEKNGVVAVPRREGKGKERAQEEGASWLEGKEWGWQEQGEGEGEVMVVRENLLLALSSSGQLRHSSAQPSNASPPTSSIAYPSAVDETLVLPPYVVSLLAPPPPPAPAPGPSTAPPPPPTPTFPSIAVHSVESLAPVQSIALPPKPEPASLLDATAEAADTDPPKPISARFLTAASTSAQPPMLLLTSAAPPPGAPAATQPSAADQTLWIVSMKSWQHQVEELGQQGEWDEAITLLRKAAPTVGEVVPAPLMRRLAMLHGLSLYRQGKWGLAVDAFIWLEVTPAKVVGLWPEAISGKLVLEEGEKEEAFGGRRYVKREVEEEEEGDGEGGEKNEIDSTPAPSPATAAASPAKHGLAHNLLHSIHLPRSSSPVPTVRSEHHPPAADPKAFARSVDELIRYLTDRRQKYNQALAALPPASRPSPSQPRPRATAAELLDLPDLPLTELKPDELARAAQVVDTALFRSYLATKAVMVGPLCRIENWCEVDEVEGLLLGKRKFRELLDLYNGKGMHDRAVKLLKQMAEDEDDDEEKVGPTVRYLQKLGAEHVDLIFDTSKWVFEADPKAAIDVFVADLEEVESLPRHQTMAHLDSIGRAPCVAYLEHIIHQLGEQGPEFHEKLIELYLAEVQAEGAKDKASGPYRKLLDFLEASTAYRADRMLGRLPSEDLYEVRAILLGRLGRHEGALQIYVYQLEDHRTAEDYCSRVYASTPSMQPTIFHLLLRIYLRPRPNHPLLFAPALDLISAHAGQMDPNEVFDLLPPLVALGDLKGWLEKSLRRSGERRREARVVRGVGRAECGEKGEEVAGLEGRRVRVDEGRLCPVCHKRLGSSVIAIHSPRGEVTHYQCREAFLSR